MQKMKWVFLTAGILTLVYLLGPHPATPHYDPVWPVVPAAESLDSFVSRQEQVHHLKPNNEARIVWANDSMHQPTDYSIVYLHGFSASQEEGDPVHRNIAHRYGCNLFLSRLAEHGIDTTEQLVNLTADRYWESAKNALAIGKQLGNKVILMGTSTGATQAIQLAATYPKEVAAIVLYSPNIAINDPNAWLLNNPWGLQIARLVKGGKYHNPADERPIYAAYWNKPYRLEAVVNLQEMLETTMKKSTFEKVEQPTLLLYYYKDEAHQDPVVKVSAMKEMFDQLSTPASQKRAVPMPHTGDHVMASPIKSKDVASVENATRSFMEQILKIRPVQP